MSLKSMIYRETKFIPNFVYDEYLRRQVGSAKFLVDMYGRWIEADFGCGTLFKEVLRHLVRVHELQAEADAAGRYLESPCRESWYLNAMYDKVARVPSCAEPIICSVSRATRMLVQAVMYARGHARYVQILNGCEGKYPAEPWSTWVRDAYLNSEICLGAAISLGQDQEDVRRYVTTEQEVMLLVEERKP